MRHSGRYVGGAGRCRTRFNQNPKFSPRRPRQQGRFECVWYAAGGGFEGYHALFSNFVMFSGRRDPVTGKVRPGSSRAERARFPVLPLFCPSPVLPCPRRISGPSPAATSPVVSAFTLTPLIPFLSRSLGTRPSDHADAASAGCQSRRADWFGLRVLQRVHLNTRSQSRIQAWPSLQASACA